MKICVSVKINNMTVAVVGVGRRHGTAELLGAGAVSAARSQEAAC